MLYLIDYASWRIHDPGSPPFGVDPPSRGFELPPRYAKMHEPKVVDYRKDRCPTLSYEWATNMFLIRSFFNVTFRFDLGPTNNSNLDDSALICPKPRQVGS